jgi:1-deoxy-D-xylulose-5-phosphate synthase
MGGLHPVVCVYSTFLNRAFDQVLMDVALHHMPVTFVLDRAGITGTDGPSHHGMWDLTLLGTVPGMRVAAPRDAGTLRAELQEAVAWSHGPTALRFPKADVAPDVDAVGRIGSADVLRTSERPDVLMISIGAMAGSVLAAADELADAGVAVTVADPRWLLPIDPDLVREAARYDRVVTVEDSGEHGGYGDAFARALRASGAPTRVQTIGLAQRFVPHGSRSSILVAAGLDASGIAASVRAAA